MSKLTDIANKIAYKIVNTVPVTEEQESAIYLLVRTAASKAYDLGESRGAGNAITDQNRIDQYWRAHEYVHITH